MPLTLRLASALLVSLLAVTTAVADGVPAGAYRIEPSHASLLFKVDHLGFSNYTARFRRFDATLQFDPARLAASQLGVTVDATSIETDFPDPAKLDFNKELQGANWLDAAAHPQMTFRSKRVVPIGERSFRIEGELTLRGITRPVNLDARYNGGYAGHPMDPNARIGFSAIGRLKRSDFGMTIGIPAPGTTMGVGDDVQVIVEAEFTGPPLKKAATP
jgi:polyisoprenoid-binding protein YceI